MAVTYAQAALQAATDAVVDLVDGGKLRLRDGTTTICDITLGGTAFGAANASGVATASGLPLSGTAGASGDVDNYQVLNSSNALVWSGVVSGIGGGGDLIIQNTSVADTQVVNITAWTHNANDQ
jgi:hypothetical protein